MLLKQNYVKIKFFASRWLQHYRYFFSKCVKHPARATTHVTRGAPWTSRQFIAGLTCRDKRPFTLTFTPTGNLESLINLTSMSLDWERKPEYPERTHADTGENMQTLYRQALPQGNEPRTLILLSADH